MNIVLIEDEARAAKRLKKLILEVEPNHKIIAILESVKESISFLAANTVDLIFSDIQLGDGVCFEIFKAVDINCPIIFTTAYDKYAVKAFDTNGIAYLLKPIKKESIEKAILKLENLKNSNKLDLSKLIETIEKREISYKQRFIVKIGIKIKTIQTENIDAFYSQDKGTYLVTKEGKRYLIEKSLEQINDLLNPFLFYRINRKYILSLEAISEIITHSNSRLKIVVNSLKEEKIIVARERVKEFKQWIDK